MRSSASISQWPRRRPNDAANLCGRLGSGWAESRRERTPFAIKAVGWLADFLRDSRHAVHLLRNSPQFTTVAILCLALGIGGIAAMFRVFDAVLIRPLPYADADRLVMIWDSMGKTDVLTRHNPTPAEWVIREASSRQRSRKTEFWKAWPSRSSLLLNRRHAT
jgi:hypothetical protein